MKLYAILPIVAATISFTVGFYDFLSWVQRKKERYSFSFIVICICIGLFGLACAGEYNSETPGEIGFFLRCESVLLCLSGLFFLLYVADLTALVTRAWILLFFSIGILGIIAEIIGFGTLTWNPNEIYHVIVALPGNNSISYLEINSGPITNMLFIYGMLLLVYCFYISIRHYTIARNRSTRTLIFVQLFIAAAYLNDYFIDQGWYSFIYLVEYSWLVVVIMVGIERGQQIIEAARVKKALAESENRYRIIFESLQDVYFQTNRFGCIQLVSPSINAVFGYNPEQIIGISAFRFLPDPGTSRDFFTALRTQSRISDRESNLIGPDGRRFVVSITAKTSISDQGLLVEGMIKDIAERKQTSLALKIALQEKNVLLNELHHRVKNNLQVISSLLKLQQNKLQEQAAKNVIQECRNQLLSMALIHDELYQSGDFMNIDFGQYLKNLTQRLVESFGQIDTIVLVLELDKVTLEIGRAIPCGLIVNELCTNALKYAFPPDFKGDKRELRIKLINHGNDQATVEVADTGIGLPINHDLRTGTSLGFRIIDRLCHQLGTDLNYEYSGGSFFSFLFNFSSMDG